MLRMMMLLLAFGPMAPAAAEELRIPLGRQGPIDIAVPDNGDHRNEVLERFGLADQEHPAIGQPPISRWDYREFSVYFEHDRVVHSVAHHRPTSRLQTGVLE